MNLVQVGSPDPAFARQFPFLRDLSDLVVSPPARPPLLATLFPTVAWILGLSAPKDPAASILADLRTDEQQRGVAALAVLNGFVIERTLFRCSPQQGAILSALIAALTLHEPTGTQTSSRRRGSAIAQDLPSKRVLTAEEIVARAFVQAVINLGTCQHDGCMYAIDIGYARGHMAIPASSRSDATQASRRQQEELFSRLIVRLVLESPAPWSARAGIEGMHGLERERGRIHFGVNENLAWSAVASRVAQAFPDRIPLLGELFSLVYGDQVGPRYMQEFVKSLPK